MAMIGTVVMDYDILFKWIDGECEEKTQLYSIYCGAFQTHS